MDISNSENVDWPQSPVIARLSNFLDTKTKLEQWLDSDSDSLPNSWGGMTPYEANLLAIASKNMSPQVSQSPLSRPEEHRTQKVQHGSKSPLSNTLTRKPLSMSQPTTEREAGLAKRSSAQKLPGSANKPMKSPKKRQSTLFPFFRKIESSHVSASHNTSREVYVATMPKVGAGMNKMPTPWNVLQPVKKQKGAVNGSSGALAKPVGVSSNTTSQKMDIATAALSESSGTHRTTTSLNVQPLKDHKGAVNSSNTSAKKESAHYQTPLVQEKFCDSLNISRRQLFSEYEGTENRAPKGAVPFKKNKFRLDYLPDLDTEPDVQVGNSNIEPSKKKRKVDQKSEPSDLTVDSVLLNKSEPTTEDPVKQSDNVDRLTEDHFVVLRASFSDNPYPSVAEVTRLAADFGVSEHKVKGYFNNKRGSLRRKMLKQGVTITSKEEMCLYAQEARRPAWGELLFTPDDAEDEVAHIGDEASGGKYLSILCDIGLNCVTDVLCFL